MIILGWTSEDYRGRKEWASLWRMGHETSADRKTVAEFKLDNAVLRWFDDATPLPLAKVKVKASLQVSSVARRQVTADVLRLLHGDWNKDCD